MAEIFDSFIQGVDAGQQQAQRTRTRHALDQAGALYSAGDYEGAENALVAAGLPDVAGQYSALSEARRNRTNRASAQQAVAALGNDASLSAQAEAVGRAYTAGGDIEQGLQYQHMGQQLTQEQAALAARGHDAVASFALGQIQRGVPVEQRQADAQAHADQFAQQTGIPVDQVHQMIAGQTDWSDHGLQALAAEHRTASEQLSEMTRQTERREDIARQTRQFNATLADRRPQIDQASIEYAARQFRQTGHMPPLGMGQQAAAMRQQILAEAARQAQSEGSTAEADVIRQRALSANTSALAQVTRYRAQVLQFEQTAERNLGLALQASEGVRRTGSPIINDILQAARIHGVGDPSAQQLAVAINSYAEEYAKVMSGATGGAAATDSARAQAHSMINTGMTIPQIRAAAQQMQAEMANRRAALDDEYQGIVDTMHSPTLGATRPRTLPVVGANGEAHNLNFNQGSIDTIRRQLSNNTLDERFITRDEAQRAVREWDRFSGDAPGSDFGAATDDGPPRQTGGGWQPGQPVPQAAVDRVRANPALMEEFKRTFHLSDQQARQLVGPTAQIQGHGGASRPL